MRQVNLNQRIYFKDLDILRFIAAYLIVLLHCFFGWKAFFGKTPWVGSLPVFWQAKTEIVLRNFAFGVDIFFLISGFLITYLLLSERERTGRVDVVKFYIRRAFRIWPLYFLLILTAPLLTYFFFEQSPDYLYQFLFVGNFDVIAHGAKSAATDHLWSICIEEHFYLFCPLLIAFIPEKRMPQVLLAIVIGTILFRSYVAETQENYGMTLYMHTLSRIDVLAIGGLLGYMHFKGFLRFNHSIGTRILVYATFIFLFVFVDYSECGTLFSSAFKKYTFVGLAAYWAGNFLFHPGAVWMVEKNNFLHRFGKASYGIYMFNPVIILIVLHFFARNNWQNYLAFLTVVHVLLFSITFLSYRFIELPFLALKEKYAVIRSGDIVRKEEKDVKEEEDFSDTEIIPLGNVNEVRKDNFYR